MQGRKTSVRGAVTRAAADARVAEMRASHPTWKFAVLQSRQTPMPGDFT